MASIVVGAGPSGCIAAKTLVDQDEVFLFEEHKEQPVQCAGLISVSGLKTLGVKPGDSLLNNISGARFVSPSGKSCEVNPGKKMACVVDRRRFDERLLSAAKRKGVNVVNERVVDVAKGKVKTKSGSYPCDKIVLASGVNYSFHRKLGLDHPKNFLVGAQVDLKMDFDPDLVEVHFNVPGFFSWVIPAGDYARVGLCARGNPTPFLNSFLKELESDGRLKKSKPANPVYGIIPVFNPKIRTDYGWVRTVGDAAGQVKATTGGGVVLGGIAASCVGEKNYEAVWRDKIGRELKLHLLIRRLVDKICEKDVDLLVDLIESGSSSLNRGGDMDIASKTVKGLFTNPIFLKDLLLNTPRLILTLL